jgi:hypothetical protein
VNVLTLTLSVDEAAALDANVTTIILELFTSPESTVIPDTPPTEVGTIQLYPAALVTAAVDKRYCLAPHVLLNKVCAMAVGAPGVAAVVVTVAVTTESQPAAFVSVAVYVPAPVMVCSFQLYGSCEVQIDKLMLLLVASLTVRFNVAVESQPTELVRFAVYVPAAEIDCPFQLYGNAEAQIETSSELLLASLIVKFKVAVESQPVEDVRLAVYVPLAL